MHNGPRSAGQDCLLQDTEGQVLQHCGPFLLSLLPLQDIHGECHCPGANLSTWECVCGGGGGMGSSPNTPVSPVFLDTVCTVYIGQCNNH